MKHYTIQVVAEQTTPELDYDLYDELFGTAWDNGDADPRDHITDYTTQDEYPMAIQDLENMLVDLKAQGATHVAIHYNCDHPDYTLTGCSITEMDPEWMQEQKRKAQNMLKEARRVELLRQLRELDS